MSKGKTVHPQVKPKLHPRNLHRDRYDFAALIAVCPDLAPFVTQNIYSDATVDFANPAAVKMLNRALLKLHYDIDYWDIPEGYLCPPIPGRVDYLHHVADLLGGSNFGKIPVGPKIACLDIGIGANCVYPMVGNKAYGWSFVGSDIDSVALESAQKIVDNNPVLSGKVACRLQNNPKDIFYGIIQEGEYFDFSICNPPFHASMEEAEIGTFRKLANLRGKKMVKIKVPVKNFGGQPSELTCEGGERGFILDMVKQSRQFMHSCFWFTTLVSKQSNLKAVQEALVTAAAAEVKTIPMGTGNKTARIVAWTFLTKAQQKAWRELRFA
jgi:23S rRNA (adenine1618-N6)-methyltransferase